MKMYLPPIPTRPPPDEDKNENTRNKGAHYPTNHPWLVGKYAVCFLVTPPFWGASISRHQL